MTSTPNAKPDFSDIFATRMSGIPRSFIREILKAAEEPGMISFAGGLPNKDLFPIEELRAACDKVLREQGREALQYSASEGHTGLRGLIADHYKKRGIQNVEPENILITNGSQQGLDLLAKITINQGDKVLMEAPSYLGAIQAMAIYQPAFVTVRLNDDGLDIDHLKEVMAQKPKMMYLIPNFQNPSGISYSDDNRRKVADVVRGTNTLLIEDDPYGELRFEGTAKTSFMNLIPEQTVLLGTFSKTLTPGLRLGWIVVPPALMNQLLIAKQATDLHTSTFTQRVAYEYLIKADTDAHIKKIVERYGRQKTAMMEAVKKYFPASIKTTNPEGGMFLWITLPNNIPSKKLFDMGIAEKVAIVPGDPFCLNQTEPSSSARLSFSTVDETMIDLGMQRLGALAHKLCG
ncbi:MAG: PLP-dependent aminotransferase family protein [Proteobacteria bacterium]|nr:PLP-dependent aminotransferase family protein [Alphaproteobacteria bacterium]NCC02980.1 PLP-dependent aminotransferase family protein [Pseudomonadota bacterium]